VNITGAVLNLAPPPILAHGYTLHLHDDSGASLTLTTDTLGARLSIAVYRLDSLQGYPSTDILRYLWASSEWIGRTPTTNVFDNPSLAHPRPHLPVRIHPNRRHWQISVRYKRFLW